MSHQTDLEKISSNIPMIILGSSFLQETLAEYGEILDSFEVKPFSPEEFLKLQSQMILLQEIHKILKSNADIIAEAVKNILE